MKIQTLFKVTAIFLGMQLGIMQASTANFVLERDISILKSLVKHGSLDNISKYLKNLESEEIYGMKDLLDLEPLLKTCSSLSGECNELNELINSESQKRHLSARKSFSRVSSEEIKFFMLDYDRTLAPTLTPLSEDTMIQLEVLLLEGKLLAIVTDQPLGTRGLKDYFITPMQKFLGVKNRNLLRQVHLFPCAGAAYYQFDREGNLDDKPIFNFSFNKDEGELLVTKIKELTSLYEKDKFFYRDSYVSLHFSSIEKRTLAMQQLEALHDIFDKPLEFRTKMSAKGTAVLHVKTLGTNKSIAKYYILNHLIPRLNRQEGYSIDRSQVLSAGDKMGVNHNENADSQMLVLGGKNFSLGPESHPCAYNELSKRFEDGGLDLLKRFSLRR